MIMIRLIRRLSRATITTITRNNVYRNQFIGGLPQYHRFHCLIGSYERSVNDKRSTYHSRIMTVLSGIKHPSEDRSIVQMNLVKGLKMPDNHSNNGGGGVVEVVLDLDKEYRTIKKSIIEKLGEMDGVSSVVVNMYKPPPKSTSQQTQKPPAMGLKDVQSILAVSSCKGGVGKTTVAVNLAYALSSLGMHVGLFDADVYGPSLPSMVSPADTALRASENGLIEPPVYEHVKTMSYGYVQNPNSPNERSSAVARGPIVANMVTQLLTQTNWGKLDVLVLDLPPGTGDIQLTLCQQLNIDGTVVVTTPHSMSFEAVMRGLDMFRKVKVPVVSMVENMAYFECHKCMEKHELFGPSLSASIESEVSPPNFVRVPLVMELNTRGRAPCVLREHDKEIEGVRQQYIDLGKTVQSYLRKHSSKLKSALPEMTYNAETRDIHMQYSDGRQLRINAAQLRRKCRCAMCVDETTNEQLLKPEDVRDDVKPTLMEAKGNYAVAVHWTDGHKYSLYPYEQLEALASTV